MESLEERVMSEKNIITFRRYEMENDCSDMWTHPGRFNPLSRTTYKEQEQVKWGNLNIIPVINKVIGIFDELGIKVESKNIDRPGTMEECKIGPIPRCQPDMNMRTSLELFNPPRRTTYKEREKVKKAKFKIIRVCGTYNSFIVLDKVKSNKVIGVFDVHCFKEKSKTIDRPGTMEKYQIAFSEAFRQYEMENDWSDMWTHPGWFNPPRRTTNKEQEQVKKANLKIIRVCGTSFVVLEKDKSNKVIRIFDVHFIKEKSKTIDRPGTMEKYQIGEVEDEMESLEERAFSEAFRRYEMENDWPYMSTHSGRFNPPVSERIHRCEMEDDLSYMWTHPGRFNPPRRTTYKEQEQVKRDNFKRIRVINKAIGIFDGPGIKEKSKTIDRPGTMEKYQIGGAEFFEEEGLMETDDDWPYMWTQLPSRSTYKEQEQVKEVNFKIIPVCGTYNSFIVLEKDKSNKVIGVFDRPCLKEKSKTIDRPGTMEKYQIGFTDRETSVSLRESTVIYQDDEKWPNPPFLKRIQRLERKRRSIDWLSYDGCSQSLVRPTYQEQEPGIPRDVFITKRERKRDELVFFKGPIPRIMEDDWPYMWTHSGRLNPPRRTTHKEQEQVKKDNFKRIRECKEKIVIENGSEIHQPNHDVIDKEQQPGQDFNGVGKPRLTAKRININLEILFSFLKYSLLLILVGFPVADCNHQDFKWLPTNKIVKGLYQTDVQLVWKYQSNLTLDKIDISRKKTEYEKEDVAMWTPDEGSKPNTLLSTDATLEHRKEGDVGTIILTLIQPYPVDFDKQYYCTVYFENGLDSMEIELQSYKVEYQPVADVVKARPGDDVQFVWMYKYPLPVTFVDFYKDDIQDEILSWSRSDGVYDIEDEYKNRATVNLTTNKDQEEVTLTLRNVTTGDFDNTYYSLAIAATGYCKTSTVNLRRLPELLERKRRHLERWFYSGYSQLLVRHAYQEPESSFLPRDVLTTKHERKQEEFEMFKECKEKIAIVNGPEIQQTNHDVIDKEQQPGQDFIDVRKSKQIAKGVNINMEMLFSIVKYSLVIILVSFPVAGCNQRDFKWLKTNPTVKGVKGIYQKDVQLAWKYQSNLTLDKIDITRKKTGYKKKHVALWTPDEGSKPSTLLTTDVTLEHRKEGDVGTIILTLIEPYPVDFDKQYNCTVYFENGVDSMEIELQPYKVEYQPVADVVKARPGDDVQFVWIYKYPFPVTFVDFYKDNDIQNDILTWSRSDGVYDIEDEYKNRVDVNITTNNGQEEVTLTLRNVTRGDFHMKYCSLAIPANGYYSVSKITLRRLPVEEEKPKPVQKTISPVKTTISTPSSASRLSKLSMLLICSVLLVAV